MRETSEDAVGLGPLLEADERGRASADSRLLALAAPLRVAGRRIVRRPARLLLVALGVALATGALVAVASGSLILRERALQTSLDAVPLNQRAFRADEVGIASATPPASQRAARHALALLSARPAVEGVEFHPLRLGTSLVDLTAIEGIGRFARLESGRLPKACVPRRCEVLQIGGRPLPRVLTAPGLHVFPVGRASLTVPSVLGDYTEPSNATLLVGSDVRGLASIPALEGIFRTASWVVPLRPGDVHEWNVPGLLAREANAQGLLQQADPSFGLTAPDEAFTDARTQGRVGSRRMLLVGGEIAVLLLGFALLASVGLRRPILAEWRRLEERGARRSQLWLFLVAEAGAAALAGALVGVALGIGAAVWIASRSGVAASAVLAHGVLTWETLLLVGATWLVATVVLVLALRGGEAPRAGPIRLADVLALGVLATAIVAASRGSAGADTLASDRGSVVLLLLFPGLVALFAALAARRLLAPALRVAERGARRSRPSLHLAFVSLSRAPARTAIAVAFLVVSIGLALLAAGYRATLERGVRDEAAYQVPLDYVLGEGTKPVALSDTSAQTPIDYVLTQGAVPVGPLDVATVARYQHLAPGVSAYPVLRRSGDVPGVGTEFASPLLLGLEPGALRSLHGWRSDFGRDSPATMARLLAAGGPVHLVGPILPNGTTGLALAARTKGADVDLTVDVAGPSGAIVRVPLTSGADEGGAQHIPAHGRVVGLELALTQAAAVALAHSESEGSLKGPGPKGSITLTPLVAVAGSRSLGVVTSWRGWAGHFGARRLPGTPTRIQYALSQGQTALFRPRQPTDGHPIPLVVSPDVARSAPDALVTIDNGDQQITGKIVAVARRFPGTAESDGSFVIADESHLQTALDASSPGTGQPLEVWLSVPAHERGDVRRSLARHPFSHLTVASRQELERGLHANPLSRAIEVALAAGALLALGLAVCGLWLTLLGDVTDERGELYDLEAQGVAPSELRNQLRLRVGILALLGLAGGVILGLVLSSEVVRLLQVAASGVVPVPPLLREQGWGSAGLALAVFALLGIGLVEATVRRAFRDAAPSRSGEVE